MNVRHDWLHYEAGGAAVMTKLMCLRVEGSAKYAVIVGGDLWSMIDGLIWRDAISDQEQTCRTRDTRMPAAEPHCLMAKFHYADFPVTSATNP